MTLLDTKQKAAGVVTFSSGNHAQAVALAGSQLNVETTIIMPSDAPKIKIESTRKYGGSIIFYDRHKEDREEICKEIIKRTGKTFIHPFNDVNVIAGAGTAVKELLESVGKLDYLFVCLGGGGLLSGSAIVAKELCPDCKVYGVEPIAGNDAQQSFRSGTNSHSNSKIVLYYL